MKRSQHSGNILQRRAFLAPLLQGARGFAFEINDHKIAAGVENLAEMIVAVDASQHGREFGPAEKLETLAGAVFQVENRFRFPPDVVRHFLLAPAKQVEVSGQETDSGVHESLLLRCGEGLWCEIRILARRRQSQVKLGRPPAQQRCRIQIRADALPGFIRESIEKIARGSRREEFRRQAR